MLVKRSGKKSYIGVLLIVVTRAILVHEAPVTKKLLQLACTKTGHSSVGNHPPTKTKQKKGTAIPDMPLNEFFDDCSFLKKSGL